MRSAAVPRRDDVRRLGQHRPRRVDPHHPRRPRRRDQLRRHRRRVLARRVRGDRRQGARGGRRDEVVLATKVHGQMGDGPEPARATRGAGSPRRSRTACAGSAPTGSTSTRSTGPTRSTDIDETLGALTDLVAPGQDPLLRLVDVPGARDRRGAVGGRAPRPRALRLRAAAVLDPRAAGSRPTCCRRAQRYGMGVIPWSPLAGGWLTGSTAKGGDAAEPTGARSGSRQRFDLSMPGNQRKLDAVERARAARRGGRA